MMVITEYEGVSLDDKHTTFQVSPSFNPRIQYGTIYS
jgi:hypothetical protein